ncbi:RNA polymerase [Synechococcus phage S-CBP42]|uniref:DNA-directed RNA polymerase n=1 Tax=Synechococcus phage S-CBP42 TaxID=461711 RepID=A0A096VKW2_9CAUD|nr:RNA polymerase [Synechococcus phage S-CBP42]AGK86693.1 RNA polymerase [Synechococcus phage S-CBP42]
MNNLNLVARQLRRELEQGEEARRRLQNSTRKAHERAYASSTVYGQKLLKTNLNLVAQHLKQRLRHIFKGGTGEDYGLIHTHLKAADPEILALLTMKVALDVLGQERFPSVNDLTIAIGSAVETELRLSWYRKVDPDLYRKVANGFHSSTGTQQKATVFRLRFNKAGLEWQPWGRTTRHKVGAWCLDGMMSATGWIVKEMVQHSTRKRSTVLHYSREFLGIRDSIMEQALRLAYCMWPMLCPPNDWSNEERGGYLTEDIRQMGPMVRKAGASGPCKQGDIPISFLNNLQRVSYRLNPAVLATANTLFDRFHSVGSMVRMEHLDPPPAIPEDADEETVNRYKRDRRRIEDHNAQLEQKNWRTTETLFVANLYSEETFWLPWSFDYRGRVYSQVTGLNPQGTDFDKSLIYFAEEGPVSEPWLAWHVATTAGHDKLSHESRRQWTRDNLDQITAIAEDPLGNLSLWADAGEPWCFLAACLEYHACCIACTKQTSGLPIGIDATCSGLQHLASMTLDRTAAEQVNVVRGAEDRPADGYRTVAEVAIRYIDDETVHPFIDRKVTKRTVMTVPYGVSRTSARDYIRSALIEKKFDLSIRGRLPKIVDAIYKKAVPEVFAGPVDVMKWLQESAETLLESKETIQWTTPSGFNVTQDLRKSNATQIKTKLMGSVLKVMVGDGWGDPDVKHHIGAIAPNLVHSLDASLLHLTFAYWDKPFTVIHDCVLGRSCDMDQMGHDIRLHHAEIYKGLPLVDWAKQVGVEVREGLIKGDLDMDEVLDSPYFFC